MSLSQFKKKLKEKFFKNKVLVWFYPYEDYQSLINLNEIKLSEPIYASKDNQFRFSRNCARNALSNLFSIDCKEVPLIANSGEPPILEENLGYVSFSHSKEAFVIAWAYERIGIDIENSKRKIKNLKLISNFLTDKESNYFIEENNSASFLSNWVLLESAIKWNKGQLLQDIKDWKLNKNLTLANNIKKNISVCTKLVQYKNFFIGIACNKLKVNKRIIICR